MSSVHHARILTHNYEENLGPGQPRAARPKEIPLHIPASTIRVRLGEGKEKPVDEVHREDRVICQQGDTCKE